MIRPIIIKLSGLCVLSTVLMVLTLSKSRQVMTETESRGSYSKYKTLEINSLPENEIPSKRKFLKVTGLKVHKSIPDSIIIGVSKCGTRAMLEYLRLHPDVAALNAEIGYYYNDSMWSRGQDWYISQMPDSEPGQITVVKSPDCFQHQDCADRIYADNKKTKLLVLLRDPVERLVSQYMQLRDKHDSFPTFEKWIMDDSSDQVNIRVSSVTVSAYAVHLVRWLNIFPRKQLHITKSESLRSDPLTEMRSVEKFLNITPFYSDEDFYYNASRGFYCVRNRLTWKTKCLGKSKGREHIPVKETILNKLYAFYRPYNEQLNHLMDIALDWP
ncbi:heparan sulfate glucosamine 3-O-sulfotransferase 1 [Biomphalaria glabrata]|uniref:Heparan sulfate glucosamine 3-O-sulfotransferase 5-like isoform X2 n=1 Tax=Biomphalaria glabrata TaxID=6526 RepID=A0A9W3ADB9_BIOGL|nr:heparan sulfate glucosamine 3-O-sulfotransferase 5-like isoform X2 [Biomphalaria glabrata]